MSDTSADTAADTASVTSSVTSFSDISVCEEIGQLINQCHQLHEHIHNSSITLENIKYLVENNNNIQVTYNGLECDFDEVIEVVHASSLKNIEENGTSNFSEKLLEALDSIVFH